MNYYLLKITCQSLLTIIYWLLLIIIKYQVLAKKLDKIDNSIII
jgi:hypothetical protein